MKSLIKFIAEESAKKGRKVTTAEIRRTIDSQLTFYKKAIDELEDLRSKTFHYDEMEQTLVNLKSENALTE
jgi:chaperonin cofactor prefoldin